MIITVTDYMIPCKTGQPDLEQHLGEIVGGSGLSIYGAVLGAALGIWVFSKFKKLIR